MEGFGLEVKYFLYFYILFYILSLILKNYAINGGLLSGDFVGLTFAISLMTMISSTHLLGCCVICRGG